MMQMRTTVVRRVGWLLISLLAVQPAFAVPTTEKTLAGEIRGLQEFANDLAADFSRDAMLDKLDYDAEEIVTFVTEQIAFQAYPGVLRHSAGTLAARAGNAHDQALTLASLLKDAGYEAQILVGELSATQARQLNASMRTPPAEAETQLPPGLLRRALERTREYQVSVDQLVNDIKPVVQQIRAQISDKLSADKSLIEDALAASRAYRWVRYREGPADAWIEVHPALAGAAHWQLSHTAIEADRVHEAAVQQLSIKLWIENSAGERHLISDVVEAPIANLMQSELTLEISSDAALDDTLWQDPTQFFEQSHYFYLSINGDVPKRNKLFDLRGNVYAGSGVEGLNTVFATLNKNSQKALDSLRGISGGRDTSEGSRKELTRVWFEFHLPSINGEDHVVERDLFTGRAMADGEQAALALLQRWTLDIAGSSLRQSVYLHSQAERAATALEQFSRAQKFAAANPDAPETELIQRFSRVESHGPTVRLKYLRSLFERLPVDDEAVSYMPTANILAVRQGFSRDADQIKIYEMVDIVANPRWSFTVTDEGLRPAPEISVARGVWETFAEQQQPIAGNNLHSVETAYARLAGASSYVLDASAGSIALYASDADVRAWWQIDASTGATVGMLETTAGVGGASVTERLVLFITAGISVMFAAVGTATCTDAGGGVACCFTANAAIAVLGFIIAMAIGKAAVALAATSSTPFALAMGAEGATFAGSAQAAYGVGGAASVVIDVLATNINVTCSQSAS
jgi:hypothetical protein